MNNVKIIVQNTAWKKIFEFNKWCRVIQDVFDKTLLKIQRNTCKVGLLLSDDNNIIQLNKKFRKQDKVTNVLSFPQYEPNSKELTKSNIYIGDIILAYETIMEESHKYKTSYFNRCTHLFVHGVLHLFGIDHITDIDRLKMESLEIEILELFNIQNPYIYWE